MYCQKSPDSIRQMFDSIAKKYDRNNALLSFGMHRYWTKVLVNQILSFPNNQPVTYFDLCCGTGDVAFQFLKSNPALSKACLIDFSSEMLECAKRKANHIKPSFEVSYIEANVQKLPFEKQSADLATMAYGIRNMKSHEDCLTEVYRILKPGGRFALLELTRPASKLMRVGHSIYLHTILPLFGKAYHYLCQSIEELIPLSELETLFHKANFIRTKCLSLAGGIASIIVGHKPG
jgi:demethylmenaquinone methyltransferase / 2-methoxy-6-polyprenyl-1,4-benzoquinol methylase